MGKIELLWKFSLQSESATIMHLLLALALTKRFDVRVNNKRVGNDNRGEGLAIFSKYCLEFRKIEKVRS